MKQQSANFYSRLVQLFRSEYAADALRNTLAVVLPIFTLYPLGWPTTAIGIGVGALMTCMTDLPGNRGDKFKSAWISILVLTIVAMLSTWSTNYPWVMIALLVFLTFMFTMVGVMGNRMAAIGLMGITLATFTIGLKPEDPLLFGFYIFLGGSWYYAISLLQISLLPYRSIHRALAQATQQTAALLRLRAQGYNPSISLAGFNDRNIYLHLKLANQHELIRQLLLSDYKAYTKSSPTRQAFLAQGLNLIDLYEQVSAVHYDYPYLRKQFADTGALPLLEEVIDMMASLLKGAHCTLEFEKLRYALLQAAADLETSKALLLKQILANIDEIYELIRALHQPKIVTQESKTVERYSDFLTLEPVKTKNFKEHFSFSSATFRFSLRLSALGLVALLLINWLSDEHYSYWLLLTMVMVSRPSYEQTLKRNGARLLGTALGLILGFVATHYLSANGQIFVSILSLFGFFAFNRMRYGLSVVFITVAVIVCMYHYEGDLWHLISDRVLFTLLGVSLCLMATFIFPIWNAPRLTPMISAVLIANKQYFMAVVNLKPHAMETIHQTRLARKASHQQLSALSEAIQAAQKEPFHKSINWPLVKRLQLLNYQFNVLTALLAGMQKRGEHLYSGQHLAEVATLLQQATAMTETDVNQALLLPTWSDKPMNLVDVSRHLVEVMELSQKHRHAH